MIVFLNGTSSSGKSSIAEELLQVLDTWYFHMSIDAFAAMCPGDRVMELAEPELNAFLRRMRAGFHRSVVAMAQAGNDIVVDHLFSEPWRLQDCLEVMEGLDVVLVGVHCPLEELERRELARGDRTPGMAANQFQVVHQHGLYDFEVDTSRNSPRECAEAIKQFLDQPPGKRAFDELRGRARGHDPSTG